ncbi:HEAT repeat domain-containing protein [Tumidithrix elongata RA019]|uniref:HEAT repeat domain-containing protein n=1 Tax=Tumidithrix elongata BACA0141 TaxID=2716417 RepID=A0AAW9Q055_9CYAN|nr:HEAT repeat domain-containing protein [Tumidithrix elongata RA019]
MELIKRTTLLYQAGSSAKVYEIDLCRVGENRYVVNSRYGRQGSVLKENSETVTAISLEKAQTLLDRLVNAKISKGYRDATGESGVVPTPIASPPPPAIEIPMNSDTRTQAILNRLVAILNAGVPSGVVSGRRMGRISKRDRVQQPLDRIIWRVGELKIAAAVPLLLRFLNTSVNPIRNYAIAWSLGWCGDPTVIPTLEGLYQNSATPDSVRRIAFEAVFKLADSAKQAEMRSQLIAQLPIALQDPVRNGTSEQFAGAFQAFLNSDDRFRFMAIELLYQIDRENIRPVILEVLRTVPLQFNYFQRVRHIFKIAEYRQDAEAFAILARRFDANEPASRISSYRDPRTREIMIFVEEEGVAKEFPLREHPEYEAALTNQVYTQKTRSYLRRRVWRSLRKLGELNDPNYVRFAVSILLQHADADAEEVRRSIYYKYDRNWSRFESARIEWDIYAKYLTFNHILYEHSPRYFLKPNTRAWRCVPPYKPGNPEPQVREEAFPRLWEQHPTALLQLLLESECHPVHQFAVKAIRACQQFLAGLELENLIKILDRPYEVTAQLGFELARLRYQSDRPDGRLILAVANCNFAPARTEAYRWINEQRDRFLTEDSQLIAGLVLSKQSETRTFARQLLGSVIGSVLMNDATVRTLIGHIIALLLKLNPNQIVQAKFASETLLLSFSFQLRSLGLEIILDLLRHPLPEIQTLGAQILVNHETNVMDLPSGLLDALLESPYDNVRVLGVRLFGQLPDRILRERTELILTFVTHAIAEMREAIRPIVHRLASGDREFSLTLARQLIQVLLAPEEHEGVHKFLCQLLQTALPDWMSAATPETATQLLQATSGAAQEVAGCILLANVSTWANSFTTAAIAQLGNHEVQAVRSASYAMCERILQRLHRQPEELLAALPLLESRWDDSRLFGFRLFGELLQPEDFTPAVIISICDSVRADVRKFGRDLVSRCFKETDGQEYLVKFSEHPSTDMQLFATNYLENYAVNNPSRLQELIPYFTRVLAQVNRGRVTKQRVFAFLDREATKSEAAASIVAQILTRQSAAIAIGDKAKALESLLKIHLTYPQIPLPIKMVTVPTKS